MTGLWLILGAMTVLAAALVAWPLLRPPRERLGRRDYELRVYRAQLEEVARERERGLLGEREAEAARLEVERRMLAADAAKDARVGTGGARWAVALVLIVLPLLAGGLYWRLGRPDLPSVPFASRAGDGQTAQPGQRPQAGALPSVETMIARLEQRLARSPDDLAGWQRLGQAYETTEQFDQAARAWRQAIMLDDGDAQLHAALGEALVMAAGGIVTPDAAAAFDRALALDAGDPRARFYRGLALLQAGDRRGAFDAWVALIESSPGDAPWLPELRRRVAGLANDLGIDPKSLPAPPAVSSAPGPSAEQRQAAENMSDEDREAMIRDMVAGLAARLEDQPDDIEGWRMLGRSYRVLGEPAKSAEAYRQVAQARPDDLSAQLDYADALVALAATDRQKSAVLTEQMGEQLDRVLALDPDNPMALFYSGQVAAETGNLAEARDYWQRLLARMPPDAPERAQVQRLIDGLDAP